MSLWASEPGLSFCGTGIGYNVNGSPYYGRIDNTRGSSYLRLIPGETKFMFQKTSGETVDAMTINESGKIGIGTATPLAKLHINSGANNNYAAILATSNEGNNLVVSSHDTSPHSSVVFKIAHEYSNNPALRNNGYISFYRGSSDNGGFLEFGTSGLSRLRITPDGKVGIGTTNPQYALDVKGKIRGTEIRVEPVSAFPDYVFEKDYNLRDLKEVHDFINKNGHLPEIPTAQEVKENGIDLAEMQVKLLQKIEELTLYIIELENRITHLETK